MSSAQPCGNQDLPLRPTSANDDLSAHIVRHTGSWIDTTDNKNQALLTLPQSIDLNLRSSQRAPIDSTGYEKDGPKETPSTQSNGSCTGEDKISVATALKPEQGRVEGRGQ